MILCKLREELLILSAPIYIYLSLVLVSEIKYWLLI